MKDTIETEVKTAAIPELKNSEELLESLKELRLKHWSEAMLHDMADMTPAEQGLILKSLSKWSQTEKAERRAQMIATKIRSSRFKRARLQVRSATDPKHNFMRCSPVKDFHGPAIDLVLDLA